MNVSPVSGPSQRPRPPRRRRWAPALLALVVVGLLVGGNSMGPAAAASVSHAQITGDGSSWAANAVNQWVSDVTRQGIQVVFTSTGSAQGRQDYANKLTDFGVSDIAYQGVDPATGKQDASSRPYAYLPIVAGGTSFPYHIQGANGLITGVRLSGATLAKIFTNQITNWDDPAITADNNGKALPNLRITPVVHSEGSGSTAQFTAYLNKQFPAIWSSYSGLKVMTEYYPAKGNMKAQNGSDTVISFINSPAGNGSIGFDEYSYALQAGLPVAKIENAAGYFTLPTQYNVAVALTAAVIDPDPTHTATYLTQKLDAVYVNPDRRTYALSSYSYAIIPIGNNTTETHTATTAKRQSLADFLDYAICTGQAEVGPIGYSSLPVNLVTAGFGQIQKLKQADSGVVLSQSPITSCNNPTFDPTNLDKNKLAEIAPQPAACDKAGAGPCIGNTAVAVAGSGTHAGTGTGPGNTGTTNNQSGASGNPNGTGTGGGKTTGNGKVTTTTGPSGPAGPTAAQQIDPNTGLAVNGADPSAQNASVQGNPAALASSTANSANNRVIWILTVVFLISALVLPVLIARHFGSRPGSPS